ncbi:MAG TPA: hypothetical protein VF887_06345 [Gemmatimonadaceae bacterium]
MQNSGGVQKGPQDHAEGQHGSKTHSKFIEQLQSGSGTPPDRSQNAAERPKNLSQHNAAHRLFEERQQHDEAEKKSEKTRLHREVERGHVEPLPIPKI